jgi:hypothetical protein
MHEEIFEELVEDDLANSVVDHIYNLAYVWYKDYINSTTNGKLSWQVSTPSTPALTKL